MASTINPIIRHSVYGAMSKKPLSEEQEAAQEARRLLKRAEIPRCGCRAVPRYSCEGNGHPGCEQRQRGEACEHLWFPPCKHVLRLPGDVLTAEDLAVLGQTAYPREWHGADGEAMPDQALSHDDRIRRLRSRASQRLPLFHPADLCLSQPTDDRIREGEQASNLRNGRRNKQGIVRRQ